MNTINSTGAPYRTGDIVDFYMLGGSTRGRVVSHGPDWVRVVHMCSVDGKTRQRITFPGQTDFSYRDGAMFEIHTREVYGLAPLVDVCWFYVGLEKENRRAA
jgi:hypothetical protein